MIEADVKDTRHMKVLLSSAYVIVLLFHLRLFLVPNQVTYVLFYLFQSHPLSKMNIHIKKADGIDVNVVII